MSAVLAKLGDLLEISKKGMAGAASTRSAS
jgi:hypothetical protein